MRDRIDPETYGGAYLLGVRGISVIAHGNSSRRAIRNAVLVAARGAEHGIVDRMAQRVGGADPGSHLQDGDPANTVTQVRESATGETAT
jgi:fatty acid/phospholipid biosynthesis enzyme